MNGEVPRITIEKSQALKRRYRTLGLFKDVLEDVLRRHTDPMVKLTKVVTSWNEFIICLQSTEGVKAKIVEVYSGTAWMIASDVSVNMLQVNEGDLSARYDALRSR